ncbi:interferon-activable protein 204 isoform X2 [Peromyscus leucopus]|uniref:interferon-activable protein 204 isoform X2 n=1 Tax=Peromyscus leucopus TaxID=10041 RepID=UPI0010A16D09|nr:interferon-activable protein 204 isoform X2 [Peromyscus leucopus]
MSEYKTIVLQQGLEDVAVDDYQFRKIKSLLRQELKLTKKMQDDYDKIQLADLMEDTFPKDAGLNKLIEVCQRIKELEGLAKRLRTERAKVKGKSPLRKKKQEAGSDTPTSTTSNTVASDGGETSTAQKRKSTNKEKTGVKRTKRSEGPDHPPCAEEATASCQPPVLQVSSSASSNTPSAKNQKTQIQTQSIARGAILQKDAMTVMVLNAIDPFVYELPEQGGKKMFHATVATVNEYFHVKVFNINLKEKFTKRNIIVISNYIKFKGILVINEASIVCDAGPDQKIEVSNRLIKRANETPKIGHIKNGVAGTLFYGLFTLHKKTVNPKNTIYEVKDDSGNIEVVGNGKCYNIKCEEGDKLQLFSFQLKTIGKQPKLVCGDHSFIKTPKKGNLPKEPSKVEGHHREPKEVMVLKVTEPFTYDLIDGKRMFHATVATETEFFRVKVFETALKNKFIPKKIIAISDYFGTNGFLEIYGASCVSDENVNQTMVISNTLRRRANGTPKIKDLFSQIKGTYVNGEFMVTKKNERGDFIYYGIEDDTGKMEVVVYGRLTSINCEPGNKLRLVCFELTSTEDTWQLKSVRHSYMQVINARRRGTQP